MYAAEFSGPGVFLGLSGGANAPGIVFLILRGVFCKDALRDFLKAYFAGTPGRRPRPWPGGPLQANNVGTLQPSSAGQRPR